MELCTKQNFRALRYCLFFGQQWKRLTLIPLALGGKMQACLFLHCSVILGEVLATSHCVLPHHSFGCSVIPDRSQLSQQRDASLLLLLNSASNVEKPNNMALLIYMFHAHIVREIATTCTRHVQPYTTPQWSIHTSSVIATYGLIGISLQIVT